MAENSDSGFPNLDEGCIRGFTIRSEVWYGQAQAERETADEIMVGMYHPEGGTSGEFAIRWVAIGRESVPRLEAFNDSWHSLSRFADLLQWMASMDDKPLSPQQCAQALRGMGIRDLTKRRR